MAYRGHLENGVVVFDEPVNLPEGSIVRVERAAACGERPARSKEDAWLEVSLRSAMRGMEEEESPYTLSDLKEFFR